MAGSVIFIFRDRTMWKSLFKLAAVVSFQAVFVAHAGIVVESTRYLYKEGTREISAQVENKDNTPYLIKSWVEAPEGKKESYFMVTPPLFRLEAKQTNSMRILPNAHIVNAPKDRDTVYYFNVMSIPPTAEDEADKNKIQLAVRHRMRLVYRPVAVQQLTMNDEVKKIEWRKANNNITLKNPTPFFIYFKSVQINGKEIRDVVTHIEAYATKEFTLPAGVNGSQIVWKASNENGGTGPANTSSF